MTAARPRVLHVIECPGGGTLRHLVDVISTLDEVEHHVVVPTHQPAALSGSLPDAVAALRAAGGTVHRCTMVRRPLTADHARGLVQLRRLLATLEPDVVHGHSSIGGAYARLGTVATPYPVVYSPHGLVTSRGYLAVERMLGPRTECFVAVSHGEAARLVRAHIAPAERVVVILNGIDLSGRTTAGAGVRARAGIPADAALVGTVGRLVPQKDPEEFVRVCAAVAARRPETHFLIIGAGELQGALDRAVGARDLRGHFHQIPSVPDAAAAMGEFDVFVLTSRFEGGPYTPLEAMRAGVPVVLSDVVGNADIVRHGQSGFLVSHGQTEAMAAAVVALLDDPGERTRMVEAARQELATRFDLGTMAAQMGDLYRKVMAERPARPRRRRRMVH